MRLLNWVPFLKVITVYEVSREYGGAEEGGWWYDAYNVISHTYSLTPERTKAKLKREYAGEHTGKNKVLSVDPIPDDYDPIDPNDETGVYYGKDIEIHVESLGEIGQMAQRGRPYYE